MNSPPCTSPCLLTGRTGAPVKVEEVMKCAKDTHRPGDNVVRSLVGKRRGPGYLPQRAGAV